LKKEMKEKYNNLQGTLAKKPGHDIREAIQKNNKFMLSACEDGLTGHIRD